MKLSEAEDISHKFVLTDQSVESVKLLEWCVKQGVCVLLSGPVGSGKTALVEYVACKMKRSMVKLQISDDTDARTLLGGYCCTEIPGQFEWRQGPLLSAMTRGSWLLLEDVACGQTNLLGMLRPLLEATSLGKTVSIRDQMQNVTAHANFRLIVTQSLMSLTHGYGEPRIACTAYGANCLSKCQPVMVHSLSTISLQHIITRNYPKLVTLLPKLIGDQGLIQFIMRPIESRLQSRINSARDLFNFCRRITNLDQTAKETECTLFFLDAADCFIQHIPDQNHRIEILNYIGSVFNLNRTEVESILNHRICSIVPHPVHESIIDIGRVSLTRRTKGIRDYLNPSHYFAQTRQMMQLLESLARCVQMREPVLLVSETGCGKTSTVQFLSKLVNRKLTVINMNQQSDSSDLLGGYKPVNNALSDIELTNLSTEIGVIVDNFTQIFTATFSSQQNNVFLVHVKNTQETKDYEKLINLIGNEVISKAVFAIEKLSESLGKEWNAFYQSVEEMKKKMLKLKCNLTFSFIEGALVQAVKNGDWVLLDEINLAPPEMLQSLSGLLESVTGSITLVERGDENPVPRHSDFRLFACMNPATDVGKRNLPQGLRNRFTEIYLQELSDIDELSIIVKHYIGSLSPKVVESVVKFYLALRADVKGNRMVDGGGSRPQFSLRTLCRALAEIKNFINNSLYQATMARTLFEGLSFSFKSQLSDDSRALFDSRFEEVFKCQLKTMESRGILSKSITEEMLAKKGYKLIMGYPIKLGQRYISNIEEIDDFVKGYKITKSVSKNLKDLARIISGGKALPVLVQGETSVGKTSLIMYLAKLTGHVFHRINNHESTDIQEYLGCYVNDGTTGRLVFKEGVLVEAMKKGHWIILDELNLAPTDILEALNRVLDDNRELFITETQTMITAHPEFRIFATQNPPGLYGGRKVLSRALRNRFIELHFNPIPNDELVEILDECCKMPKSRGIKMVEAMRMMQADSKELDVVHCKRSYISLRDLFRWARRVYYEHSKSERTFDWDRHMIEEGYLLLTGKARSEEEVNVVATILRKVFKNVDIELNDEWFFSKSGSQIAQNVLTRCEQVKEISNIEWTHDFRRMAVLLIRAMECDEPTLLVGNTGCGKTTICHLAALLHQTELLSINCHMHTEASDFLGGLRPITNQNNEEKRLFKWVDGPLVMAMKEGKMFLIDEISLADDSVLERLNSVLESDKKLTLVENGEMNTSGEESDQSIEIRAQKGFQVFATMNPGGDFGKKELSPALKNRFTEIWCPSNSWSTTERGLCDWVNIAARNLNSLADDHLRSGTANVLVHFLRAVNEMANEIKLSVVSIRDLLSWVEFINLAEKNSLTLFESIVHGAFMVVIDSINDKINKEEFVKKLREVLDKQVDHFLAGIRTELLMEQEKYELEIKDNKIGMKPFLVEIGPSPDAQLLSQISFGRAGFNYSFTSKTTGSNLWRLLRALQISKKPLLLEGSPGVGKTSLVSQLAKMAGYKVIRINLSEQTDANDLFGCFLPIENGAAGQLCWRDGPLLQALKNGDWILLDEMNLASQSVLESLNACLDHRGEIFIPELNQTFIVKPGKTRLFACQNPMSEGGGRKGLPKSFVNRFTQVYMSTLLSGDYEEILACLYPTIPMSSLRFMVEYVQALKEDVVVLRRFGTKGSPWEFNLRDLCRWCDLMLSNQSGTYEPAFFVSLLFIDRFRTEGDKEEARKIFNSLAEKHHQNTLFISGLQLHIADEVIRLGQATLKITNRKGNDTNFLEKNLILNGQLATLESMMLTVSMGWMTILVGPSGAGKTSLVNILARITGNEIQTMSMNSAMDTTDLLGSFEQQKEGGKFKWMDSILVQALKTGDWLVLDTVNFCNASVLDRLNGLLEPNGTLLLTERGLLDGNELEEIKPHPNFRIFLVMDPECGGEISKAMRNRGLEISFIKKEYDLCLKDEDILSILIGVYKLSAKDAEGIVNFHHLLIDARGTLPQIKVGSVTSMLQTGALMSKGHLLKQALKYVYGETQMFFSVREDVNRFIDEIINCEDTEECPVRSMTLASLVNDPIRCFVARDYEVLRQTVIEHTPTLFGDNEILARLYMETSSKKDANLRLEISGLDEGLYNACQKFKEILLNSHNKEDNLPIDRRHLPNWSEFKNSDFSVENKLLFALFNLGNDTVLEVTEPLKGVKPSQITKDSINRYNVEEISALFISGKLSRTMVARFRGLDENTAEFIRVIRSLDFAALCNVENLYSLRKISKMINTFCRTRPGEGVRWLSTYVYHVTAIMNEMGNNHGPLNTITRRITDKLDKLDLYQDAEIVDRDDLKRSTVRRMVLRSEYPHSVLIDSEEQHNSLVADMEKSSELSIWKASNEDRLKTVLLKTFAGIMETDMTANVLANSFDTECTKIWPFILNMLTVMLNAVDANEAQTQLIRFFNDLSQSQFNLPMLPCDLQKRIQRISSQAEFILVIDWVKYLISQSQFNKIVTSCSFQPDQDTNDYELRIEFPQGFLKPDIPSLWYSPDNAVFLLISGVENKVDALTYFNNLKHTDLAKRTLRSVKERKLQLEFCKETLLAGSALLSTDQFRVRNEIETLEKMIDLQKNCLLACNTTNQDNIEWLYSVAPWFIALESDFNRLKNEEKNLSGLREIGNLWMRWGAVQMKLFAIMEPLDPQTQIYWENLYISEELALVEREETLSRTYRQIMSGVDQKNVAKHCWSVYGAQHPILNVTSTRIGELKEKLSKLSVNVGLRPVGDEKFAQLRLKTLRFLSKYGWDALCDSSLTSVKEMNTGFIMEWSMAASELLNYMLEESDSIAFPDLVEPFALGMSRTLSGMSMWMENHPSNAEDKKKNSVNRITNLFCQFPNFNSLEMVSNVINNEEQIMSDVETLMGKCDSKVLGRIHIKLLHLCLRVLLFYKNNSLTTSKNTTRMHQLLHKILAIFETLWKKQEEKRIEKEEAEGKIYVNKQKATENLTDEEIEELEIYLNVSPKNGFIDNMEMSAAMNAAANQIRQFREKLVSMENGLLLTEDTVHSVVHIASEIMCAELHAPDMSVFRDCYRFAAALISSDAGNMVSSSTNNLLTSHLAALTWEVEATETGDQLIASERPYDIYQDPVLASDLYNAGTALENLRKRLNVLLETYPENGALLAVQKKMDSVLNLSLQYPLIVFISNIEKLIVDIEQWEIVAARHVSLKSSLTDLNQLLIAWRHKELKMWSSSLTTASWKMNFNVSLEFFNFYHIMMTELTIPHVDDSFLSINAIAEPLVISLNTAKVGNYKAKLNMFKLLIASLETVPTENEIFKHRLISILNNHYDYFHLYLINFEGQLESEYKKIGKELKNFIKTQKWGEAPPKINSVSKCHKIVFKYLRQWNAAIHQPCKPMLVLNPQNALKKVTLSGTSEMDFSESRLSKWTEDMLLYFKDMWETMESYQQENKEFELRAVTESKETSDKEVLEKKWRSDVKNLQQRKRNCVTNFVKYLKELGLKFFGTPFPAGAALMTHLPRGDISHGSSSAVRCIGLRLQLDTADKSEEFAKFNDFKGRLINVCDDWLSRVCTNSTRIKNMEREFSKLKEATEELQISLAHEIISSFDCRKIEEKIDSISMDNIEVLTQWNTFLGEIAKPHIAKKYPNIVPDHMKSVLCLDKNPTITSQAVENLMTEMKNLKQQFGGYLTTESHWNAIQKQKSTLNSIFELLGAINTQFGIEGTGFKSAVIEKLSDVNSRHITIVSSLDSEISQDSIDKTKGLSEISDLVQCASVYIKSCLTKFTEILLDKSEEVSFIQILRHLESLESVVDHIAISDILVRVKDCLVSMGREELNNCRPIINEGLVEVLKFVIKIDEEFLKIMKNYHQVLVSGLDALLTVTANLMKDGFCVPSDSAWGEQSDENTNSAEKFNNFEMAGMDEGIGANDVSDQIESESQLEGTNKDDQKEQPDDQPDVPDQEDGIEMSEDFQAKTHDPEVEENDKNENQDELDELEDKMGEVGDAQETDLNKQAWDDKEEEKEEEEADKNDDDRNGGVSKDDTTEVVADNNENKDSKETKENNANKENKNEVEDECEEETTKEDFAEVNETGEDEDGPEERPDPALNQPENEMENEEVDENNPLDDFFDNDEKLNEDEPIDEGPEQMGEVQEEHQENGQEEDISDMAPNEENIDKEIPSELKEESIDIAGGIDAMQSKEDMQYDTEMGDTQNNEGSSGNGANQMKPTNVPSSSGKMDDNANNEENKESENDEADDTKNNTSENRTLGDMEKSFKRKADVMDSEENNDPKKQKITDAFAHIDAEQGDDGTDQVLDNATANQQQHIPEANDEDMDTKEIAEKEDKKANDGNDFGEIIESNGQVKEKDRKEKEKVNEIEIVEEVKEEKLNWAQYEGRSDYLARQLCEQLRNVLEPTKSNKLGGAFRTGKRLDMKKVIPYIASGFRKDKIWLRRNKPSQREYQVLLGVDNSKSMKYNVSSNLFFESLSIVLNGLTFLEVGQVGVCKFGASTEVVLPLHQQFSSEIGEHLAKTFDFTDGCSKYVPMLEKAIELFTESRHTLSSSASPDTSQLLLLLSDGDISEDITDPRFTTLVREANNRGIFIVVIVFDHADPVNSILNSKLFIGEGNDFVRYLDMFPIPNYTVLQDVTKLPSLLTDVLSQWFELASSADKGPSR